MANLSLNLVSSARAHGDRIALCIDDTEIDYRTLLSRARAVAGMLRDTGVGPGDRVGLVSSNVPAFPIAFYGALIAGAGVVPMNPQLTPREVDYYLRDSGASAVVALESVAGAARTATSALGVPLIEIGALGPSEEQVRASPPLADPVERADDDLALVLYTSGTTGQPKGAVLTHRNMATNAATTAETLLQATPDDVIMGCLPLFHVFGLTCGLNATIVAGASLVLLPRFDPATTLDLIAARKVTVFEGVPTMYNGLLTVDGDHDTTSLRTCISGGAALPVEILHAFERRFGCQILEGYGLSETSPVASFNHPGSDRRPGSIGVPVRGMEIRIVDDAGVDLPAGEVGEIAIRGEGVMAGYHGRPEATAEAIPDGWFRSGDLARRDEDGFIHIVDRKKQLIIRGGYNVYPREVEEVLYQHPAIAEVAVIGIKHDRLGEEVGAAVALRRGATADVDEIRDFSRTLLAAYKYPRLVWLVDELPKGPTGKILHREVTPPSDVTAP
ncbi:long-chain fatty acid--CoA ligase [Pseudonocardia sp. ICBG1034]|uniref:long-chain-fatty-acid--CoA ligase n=1 Tax=Pseudonocardia sp. ICBG1034 TaxID=2844381 RepID=UPI001CD00D9C|nr:long-chain fatty acid--CoA ligase [Pseudonocardia sp. ICBG1034]